MPETEMKLGHALTSETSGMMINRNIVIQHPTSYEKKTYTVLDKITTSTGATAYVANLLGGSEVIIIDPRHIVSIFKW